MTEYPKTYLSLGDYIDIEICWFGFAKLTTKILDLIQCWFARVGWRKRLSPTCTIHTRIEIYSDLVDVLPRLTIFDSL